MVTKPVPNGIIQKNQRQYFKSVERETSNLSLTSQKMMASQRLPKNDQDCNLI